MVGRKIVCAIVVSLMSLTCINLVDNVSAQEAVTVRYAIYPLTLDTNQDYFTKSYSYTGGPGLSIDTMFMPIYLNSTGTSVKSILIVAKLNRPLHTTGSGQMQFLWQNMVTTTKYLIGPVYESTTTQIILNPSINTLSSYRSGGSPMHLSFGFRETKPSGGIWAGSQRFYSVDIFVTYEFSGGGGSGDYTTVINAIAGMNASMQTRFNAVDNSLNTIGNRLNYVNNTVNLINNNVVYMNGTINNIESTVNDMANDITYLNSTVGIIDGKINGVNSNISNIMNDLTNISGDISSINATVNSISLKCDGISNDLYSVSMSISNLTNDISGVASYLFAMHNNISERFNMTLAEISNVYNNLDYWGARLDSEIANTTSNIGDIETLLNTSIPEIYTRFDNLDGAVADVHVEIINNTNHMLSEFRLTRDYVNSTMSSLASDISNSTSDIIVGVYGFISDAHNDTIANLTGYISNRTNEIISAVNDIEFDYSLITDAVNSTEEFLFWAINDVANATKSFLYDAMSDYYNNTISTMNDSFDDVLSEINVVYGATLNLTTMTLEGFNGTSEQFNYTWNLVNNTYELVQLSYDEMFVIEDMINNSTEMIDYILVSSFNYRNDILGNLTIGINEVLSYQEYAFDVISGYEALIDNVEYGVQVIIAELMRVRYTADDGLVYVLRSANTRVDVEYIFVKDRWISDYGYYKYSISAYDDSLLSRVEIDVDYGNKKLDGFWREIIVVGIVGSSEYIIDESNYYFKNGMLTIDTLNIEYNVFVVHVNPTLWTRLSMYWRNYW